MKILKYLFLFALLSFVALTVFVATQKGNFSVERSKVINSPRATVYNYLNDFRNYEDFDEQILYDLKRVFVPLGIDIIIAHEEMMLNRDQYLKALASVKAVFMPFRYESIGVELYEAMLLNTIPLAVDWSIYGDMLPNELKYDPSITENIFNYCKDAPVITNKLKDYIENYDMYRSIVENQTQHITKTYYDSSEFLEKLFGNV